MVETMDEATVDCLIDGKVDGLFIAEQARLIKKIPLARVITQDSLYWTLSQDG